MISSTKGYTNHGKLNADGRNKNNLKINYSDMYVVFLSLSVCEYTSLYLFLA